MRGVAGILYSDVFRANNLMQPMMQALRHRSGKAGHDVYNHRNVQLGLCGGTFFTDAARSLFTGIDGRLTNGDALYTKLLQRGHPCKTKDAQELIFYSYMEWGERCFEQIEGDFVIILIDQAQRRLFICRDRIGKRPLYWYQDANFFLFASELKALLATGIVPQSPAMDGLASYLYFGFIPQDMSPIQGINKLLPAHYLEIDFNGKKQIIPYWSYSSYFEKQQPIPLEKIVSDLDGFVRKNIADAFSSTDNIGCFLSEGEGQKAVANYASLLLPNKNLTAYSIDFLGDNAQELEQGQAMARQLGMRHEVVSLSAKNLLDDLLKIVWHLDEPLADFNILSTWRLISTAGRESAAILSSMGCDELFAGHPRYSVREQEGWLTKGFREVVKKFRGALIPLAQMFSTPKALHLLKSQLSNPGQYPYIRQIALMGDEEIALASRRLAGFFDPEIFLRKFYKLHLFPQSVAAYLYLDVKTSLPDQHLSPFDKITNAHAIRWASPFLSRQVEEYLAGLPEPERMKETDTGAYLKAMIARVFPGAQTASSSKRDSGLRNRYVLRSQLLDIFEILPEGFLVETGLISKSWLREQLGLLEGNVFVFDRIWAIFVLEIWFRMFVQEPVHSTPPPTAEIHEFLKISRVK